jgi:hypothetical protein
MVSTSTNVNTDRAWMIPVPGLPDGRYTVQGRARIPGQADPEFIVLGMFTVDTVPPDTVVSCPSGTQSSSTIRIPLAALSADEDEAVRFECRLDGEEAFQPCSEEADNLYTNHAITDGVHTLAVRAVDESGNIDPSPQLCVWVTKVEPKTGCSCSFPAGSPILALLGLLALILRGSRARRRPPP